MAFGSIICCGNRSDRKIKEKEEVTWSKFSLKELHSATNNFNYDNILGEGACGSVYWGQLWDGSQIAVKRLNVCNDPYETDFSIKIGTYPQVCHKNLLTLRGYCSEGEESLIVYDYMPNLSLWSHLHGQSSAECLLNWTRRMNIAITSAEGIAYLHTRPTSRVIHGGIKSSNVLLDSDFQAKVADFAFTKFIPNGASHITIRSIRISDKMGKGTIGYLSPEFGSMVVNANESTDSYSFGILLLELASGKRPVVMFEKSLHHIVKWALPLTLEKRFEELVDVRLNGKYVEDEMRRVIVVGLMCAHEEPKKRPTMREVVALLKGEAQEKLAEMENQVSKAESVRYGDAIS